MTSKQDEMIKDAVDNIAVKLPVSQIATLHNVSRQYLSQVLKENGIKVDRKNGTLTVPLSRLKTVISVRN